jgi:hypothetical protein
MGKIRRASLSLVYNNVNITADLKDYLISFSYQDNSDKKADDLQVTLDDKKGLWRSSWYPEKGAKLTSSLIVYDWDSPNTTRILPLGSFEVDEITYDGPPDTMTLKGVSVPVRSSLVDETKTRAWEDTMLSAIAGDIASGAQLELMFDSNYDPEYDRIEQAEEADLPFLQGLCDKAALRLKVSSDKIIIFDDEKYDAAPAVATIARETSGIISYSFSSSTRNIYSAARVEYQPSTAEDPIVYTYNIQNAPSTGKTLIINERVGSIAEAEKLCKKRLRKANASENTASMTLLGNPVLVAGVNISLDGFGAFDGKYAIESATHSGPSYETKLELRRTLEGY